jgi:hypothetical protein
MCSSSDTHQVQWGMLQRTKMLQRTRGVLAARVVRACAWRRAFQLWLERQSSFLLSSVRHAVRSRASFFKWEYPLLFLRSSTSFLRLLPCLPVTFIYPFILPSITRCRGQFIRKLWPIQFAFRLRISCRIFLWSLTLSNTSSYLTWSVQLIFSILRQHHIWKLSRCFWSTARSVQVSAPYKPMLQMQHVTSFFLNSKFSVLVKRGLFLLNTALAVALQYQLIITCLVTILIYTPLINFWYRSFTFKF